MPPLRSVVGDAAVLPLCRYGVHCARKEFCRFRHPCAVSGDEEGGADQQAEEERAEQTLCAPAASEGLTEHHPEDRDSLEAQVRACERFAREALWQAAQHADCSEEELLRRYGGSGLGPPDGDVESTVAACEAFVASLPGS